MNNKGETDRLLLAIKLVMKRERVKVVDLAKALKLSTASTKRSLARGPLPLERLMEICDALNVSFYELVEIARDQSADALSWMSEDQEDFLLKNPDATEFLICIMNGLQPEQIQNEFSLNAVQTKRYLFKLESVGLVTKAAKGQYKVASQVLRGAKPGRPLASDFSRRCADVAPELVRQSLAGRTQIGDSGRSSMGVAVGFELSESSAKELGEQLKKLLTNFSSIERQEARSLPKSKLKSFTAIVSLHESNLYAEAYRGHLKKLRPLRS